MNWYFICSEDSYGVALAPSSEEAIKEIQGEKKIKTAYLLKDFYLYKVFLDFDRQFHCGSPDMAEQDDRLSFYTFCAGYFCIVPDICGKVEEDLYWGVLFRKY